MNSFNLYFYIGYFLKVLIFISKKLEYYDQQTIRARK